MWQCPICASALNLTDRTWRCANNHSYDQAKSGYVNLLPVQHKNSKQPGDDKTMLRARQHFHSMGGYQPLMDSVAKIIIENIPSDKSVSLYDAGCGEGSYLDRVCTLMTEAGFSVQGMGSDISKVAVELASKAFKAHEFTVASSVNLPVGDQSLDAVMQVFAPGSTEEYARVIRNEGILVTVDPAAQHLWSLKQHIYDTPKPHDEAHEIREGFALTNDTRVAFDVPLTTESQRLALLQMTPYFWKISDAVKSAILTSLTKVEASFIVRVWKKECVDG